MISAVGGSASSYNDVSLASRIEFLESSYGLKNFGKDSDKTSTNHVIEHIIIVQYLEGDRDFEGDKVAEAGYTISKAVKEMEFSRYIN